MYPNPFREEGRGQDAPGRAGGARVFLLCDGVARQASTMASTSAAAWLAIRRFTTTPARCTVQHTQRPLRLFPSPTPSPTPSSTPPSPGPSYVPHTQQPLRPALHLIPRAPRLSKAQRYAAHIAQTPCTRCGRPGHEAKFCRTPGRAHALCWACGRPGHPAAQCPERTCYYCGGAGHTSYECPGAPPPGSVKCFNCGEIGHTSRSCEKPRMQGFRRDLLCHSCGEKGHLRRECPTSPLRPEPAVWQRFRNRSRARTFERQLASGELPRPLPHQARGDGEPRRRRPTAFDTTASDVQS